jgi:hypothetical protein
LTEVPIETTIIVPGERHWTLLGKPFADARATGNLIQDAWNAALAIEARVRMDYDRPPIRALSWLEVAQRYSFSFEGNLREGDRFREE